MLHPKITIFCIMASMDRILLICITLLLAISASSTYFPANYLSSDASYGENTRKKTCLVNFAHQNYTVLTSQCKAPFPHKPCCKAFLEFACPFAKYLNDQSTNCAQSMLHHIFLYGYPYDLFWLACSKQGNKHGIPCPQHKLISWFKITHL